jgi:hypothetical protein
MLTLALSRRFWPTLLAQGCPVEPGSAVTHFPGLLGPMLAAIAVTAVVGGRRTLTELFAPQPQASTSLPVRDVHRA